MINLSKIPGDRCLPDYVMTRSCPEFPLESVFLRMFLRLHGLIRLFAGGRNHGHESCSSESSPDLPVVL